MNDDSKKNADVTDQLPDLSEVPELQLDEVSGGRLVRTGPTTGQFPPKPIGWWFPDTVVLW
jgi:hypothetical protein